MSILRYEPAPAFPLPAPTEPGAGITAGKAAARFVGLQVALFGLLLLIDALMQGLPAGPLLAGLDGLSYLLAVLTQVAVLGWVELPLWRLGPHWRGFGTPLMLVVGLLYHLLFGLLVLVLAALSQVDMNIH